MVGYLLESLDLAGCNVTGTGLKHLSCEEFLFRLDLGSTIFINAGRSGDKLTTAVNDMGLAEIARFKNLTILTIAGASISDDGLKHLTGLSRLQNLTLACPAITDLGAGHLHVLKNLTELDVSGTRITSEGLALLRQALPNCKTLTGPGEP